MPGKVWCVRVLMVSNPNSTGSVASGPALARRVIPILQRVQGIRLRSVFTHHAGHAAELVRGLTTEDYDVVLVAGGDGTVNEVINGLLGPVDTWTPQHRDTLPALAILPTGSANVFARALGFRLDPIIAAQQVAGLLRGGVRRTLCLGTWDNHWFSCNAGMGIDAEVIRRVDRVRERGFKATPLRYLKVSLEAWVKNQFGPSSISMEAHLATYADSGPQTVTLGELPLLFVSNTNPWTFLGPLPVVTNPGNSFDKGLSAFGLSSLRGVGGVAGLLHLIGVGRNRWFERFIHRRTVELDDLAAVTLTCDKPESFQVDGEYIGTLSQVRLGYKPDALTVVAPQDRWVLSAQAPQSIAMATRDFVLREGRTLAG